MEIPGGEHPNTSCGWRSRQLRLRVCMARVPSTRGCSPTRRILMAATRFGGLSGLCAPSRLGGRIAKKSLLTGFSGVLVRDRVAGGVSTCRSGASDSGGSARSDPGASRAVSLDHGGWKASPMPNRQYSNRRQHSSCATICCQLPNASDWTISISCLLQSQEIGGPSLIPDADPGNASKTAHRSVRTVTLYLLASVVALCGGR